MLKYSQKKSRLDFFADEGALVNTLELNFTSPVKTFKLREIDNAPYKVLDAPGLEDNFYS